MKITLLVLGFFFCIGVSYGHVFTSQKGSQLAGELIRVNETSVVIQRSSDGKKINVKISQLSQSDQVFVKHWSATQGSALKDIKANDLKKKCSDLRKRYPFKFYYARFPKTSWKIHHSLAKEGDYNELHRYMVKFDEEFDKYPERFLRKTKLRGIAFASDVILEEGGQKRTAIPDYSEEILIFDYKRGDHGDTYQRHVMHHEFYHMIEEEFNKSAYWKDPHWNKLNNGNSIYGNGGAGVQHLSDMSIFNHPSTGFVTKYAMSSIEEDKAEVFAALFISDEYKKMMEWSRDDKVLLSKIQYMKNFLKSIDSEFTEEYWKRLHGS